MDNQTPEHLRILVVDDDPVILEVARGLLEAHGHIVFIRERAFGSCALVRAERVHVVLLDIEMPALRGDQVVDLIQESSWDRESGEDRDSPWPAVILHSGNAQEEIQRAVLANGAAGGIQKTSDHAAFVTKFQRVVATIVARSKGATRASRGR